VKKVNKLLTRVAQFVSYSLISLNLIDEYYIFRNPVAIGNGLTIFKDEKYLPG